MQVGVVEMGLCIPEKKHGFAVRYPINDLKEGQGFLVKPDKNDDVTLDVLRKRIVQSVRQAVRRLGKTSDGQAMKDFAVWVDEKKKGVYVALRKDNTPKIAKKAEAPKTITKKTAPAPVKASSKTVKQEEPIDKPDPVTPAPKRVPPKPLSHM